VLPLRKAPSTFLSPCAPGDNAKNASASGISKNRRPDMRSRFITGCYRNSARKFQENFRNTRASRPIRRIERSRSERRSDPWCRGQSPGRPGRWSSEFPTGEAPLLDRDRSGEQFHGSADRDKAAETPGAAGSRGLRHHDPPMRGPAI
jgi:hypothetical protein